MWLSLRLGSRGEPGARKGEGPEDQGQQSCSERSQRHIFSVCGPRGHRQRSHRPHVNQGAWHVPGPPLQTCPSEPGFEDSRWTPHPSPLHRLPGFPGGTELTTTEGQGDTILFSTPRSRTSTWAYAHRARRGPGPSRLQGFLLILHTSAQTSARHPPGCHRAREAHSRVALPGQGVALQAGAHGDVGKRAVAAATLDGDAGGLGADPRGRDHDARDLHQV